MVCGTASDAGKSQVVAGLCRLLARRDIRVAPFKAQNMALNSFVTAGGHEIGRAQAVQAWAARAEPEAAMNPILLKPDSDRTSQLVVMGRPIGHLDAAAYHDLKPSLLTTVMQALEDLRSRFDVVILEGAGSPAEINLLDHDIVNLRIAYEADLQAILVGDIDRGGVFASFYGTVALLPDHYSRLIKGFVINKFRGDPALLSGASEELERRCGVPTLGTIPFVDDVGLDAEDSLALLGPRPQPMLGAGAGDRPSAGDVLDIAVIRFPRLSNFTDLDALAIEPGVTVRLVDSCHQIGRPDLVILPGTKSTVEDLGWLRASRLDEAIKKSGALVLGICGGYQMMGHRITDHVESCAGEVEGLGWLDVETHFEHDKVTVQRSATVMGQAVRGYEIHHGRIIRRSSAHGWVHLDTGESEGALDGYEARYLGTSLHGLFESDQFRSTFLIEIARRSDKCFVESGISFLDARDSQIDRFADVVAAHLDLGAIDQLITAGATQ